MIKVKEEIYAGIEKVKTVKFLGITIYKRIYKDLTGLSLD